MVEATPDMEECRFQRIQELFQQAADLPREEQSAFLAAKAGPDEAIRNEVESLFDCLRNRKIDSLLAADWLDRPDLIGERIGPYRVMELLGEGGFGSVFLARQEEPVCRRVAIKVIKTGMDTKRVIQRFEAERQALALMDHSHIARVLDAGATDAGRPYFVMEFVPGVPITDFCDDNGLSAAQRLELFISVCQAVQHAHQKGILHRDLKPSNVLVSSQDGVPVPKVIDFGIARAIDRRGNEETTFTELGQFIGTPEYMSPEQVESSGHDLDTRTDIYSLGVLLYVLLAGRTPFNRRTLRQAACEEIRRIIREEPPPRPSQQVSRLGRDLDPIANARRVPPGGLGRLIRGDLDWIAMKAIDKNRNRRYDTAASLAADARHYLSHEPVLAGPPSTAYRFRKFVWRHQTTVAAAAFAVIVILTGLGVASFGLVEAMQARDALEAKSNVARASAETARAEADKSAAVVRFLMRMFASVVPGRLPRDAVTVVEQVLDETARDIEAGSLSGQQGVEAEVRMTLGNTYAALGHFAAAEVHFRAGVALREKTLGAEAPATLKARNWLAMLLIRRGRRTEGDSLLKATLAGQRRVLGDEHPETLSTMTDMASGLQACGKFVKAEAMQHRILQAQSRTLGETQRP